MRKYGKLKVLMVEDSKVAIKAISGFLEEVGVQPLIAETDRAAIELYQRELPDIILLDIMLRTAMLELRIKAHVRRLLKAKPQKWAADKAATTKAKTAPSFLCPPGLCAPPSTGTPTASCSSPLPPQLEPEPEPGATRTG